MSQARHKATIRLRALEITLGKMANRVYDYARTAALADAVPSQPGVAFTVNTLRTQEEETRDALVDLCREYIELHEARSKIDE